MSTEAEGPLPPRRPRQKPLPTTLAEGQETFQPASKPSAKPKKPRSTLDEPIPIVSGGPNYFERLFFGKVSTGHLASFCGQFATYQDAGVDILRSLASLRKQFARTALGPVIGRIEVSVKGGESVASAMAREPQAFDRLCVSMMKVAEARGGEPETLRSLARHYEAKQRMIRQARSAMIYPSIVLFVATCVVLLLTIFVIPKMVEFIADSMRGRSVVLPWPTRVLMAISDFMTSVGWWAVPAGLVAGFFGAIWWYRTPAGKVMLDALSLYVPILGGLRRKIETTRFARTLGSLLHAGVDVSSSLRLTADVVNLSSFRRAINGARALVSGGSELGEAISASGCFPYEVVARIDAGEESGKLPESLHKLADDYEEQVEYTVKNLGNLLQPILLVGLGGVVLFIVLGVILAYLQMLTSATSF
ncbi:type II secretion system F family protein [Tundrisphaera lichenicola]|uniref:type II secretion system F family protein n=1 Tax=Tundrisphaera lichenicola TaxID=2029860 RepID=UPI003EC0DC0E